MKEEIDKEIFRLEGLLRDLTDQLPKHSIPASMMIRIEEIEEQLNTLRMQLISEKQGDTIGDKS